MPERIEELSVHHLLSRELIRCEGLDARFLISMGEKDPKSSLAYICAPFQPAAEKSAYQHIVEAAYAASQIEGATYRGTKVIALSPHISLAGRFNELIRPRDRIDALWFSEEVMTYCDVLIIVGSRISEGMDNEITSAERHKVPVMRFSEFFKELTNPPSETQVQETFARLINSLPAGIFTKELFQRRSMSR